MSNYELTVTVNPNYVINGMKWGKMLASKQWEWLSYFFYETLKKHDIEYIMYPEFHKPPNYNLHAHAHCVLGHGVGNIDIVDILKRANQVGRSYFRPLITTTDNWCKYIRKDYAELKLVYTSPGYEYFLGDTSEIIDPGIEISDNTVETTESDYDADDEGI